MEIEDYLAQPDDVYLPGAMQNYARALEKTLNEVPVVNGAVDLETLWLETALPRDLIIEVLETIEVRLPAHIQKVIARDGRVLIKHKESAATSP